MILNLVDSQHVLVYYVIFSEFFAYVIPFKSFLQLSQDPKVNLFGLQQDM